MYVFSTDGFDLFKTRLRRPTAVEGSPKAPFSLASTVTYDKGGHCSYPASDAQLFPSNNGTHFTHQAPIVQTMDSAICWINHYFSKANCAIQWILI